MAATPLHDAHQGGLFLCLKPPTSLNPLFTVKAQMSLLEGRGLLFPKPNLAEHFLETVGYYRLIDYFSPFLNNPSNSEKGFLPHTNFSQPLQLYFFDRELRLLVMDALERIEVALRASISNTMSLKYSAHWYLDVSLFTHDKRHEKFLEIVFQHLERSNEDFIRKYYASYKHPEHPASWMIMECLSFGAVSQLLSNIKDRSCRKTIASRFALSSETLKSWVRALSSTRNACAHHNRLWSRYFVNKPKHVPIQTNHNKSAFVLQAYMIIKLLAEIAPGNHWKNRLWLLMDEHETLTSFRAMGFEGNWREHVLWAA